MKCNCGYDEYTYNADGEIMDKNKEFLRSELKVSFEADGNYYRQVKCETVYICPECGTLKISLY